MRNKIEVIGLPAAGKSTFYREQSKYALFFDSDIIELDIWKKLKCKILFFKYLSFLLIKDTKNYKIILQSRRRFWLLKKIAYRMQFVKESELAPPYLEKGLLQPLVTDAVEFAKHESIEHYISILSILPIPKAIIHFDIDANVALERYQIRGNVEPRDLTSSEIERVSINEFEHGERVLIAIKKYYSLRKVKIITLKPDMTERDKMLLCEQVDRYGVENEK